MRSFAFALASVMVLGAGSASAATGIQDGTIAYTAGSAAITGDVFNVGEGAGRYPSAVDEPGATGGANYNSFVDIGPVAISFESSNVVSQGSFQRFTSSSTVSFTFNNETSGDVAFHSEITPQGLGMYLADTSGGCIFTNSCAQVSDVDYQFAQLVTPDGLAGELGKIEFSFDILDNGVSILDDGSGIYPMAGSLSLFYHLDTADCLATVCIVDNLGDYPEGSYLGSAARRLNGFGQQTDPLDYSAIAFGWGATPVERLLAPGVHNIEYVTSVTTSTYANCLGPYYAPVCLIAYGGFGDPIGRGGGISASRTLSTFDVGALEHTGGELITGLHFTPATFNRPTYSEEGGLTFQSVGVPEPSTWALMIGGFGFMGAALRRRRIPAHI